MPRTFPSVGHEPSLSEPPSFLSSYAYAAASPSPLTAMLSAVTVLIVVVGLVQLPILTDLLIFLFPSSPFPRLASRATKPIFILLFLACCILALHLFFFTFLPLTLHSLLAPPFTSHTTAAVIAGCLTFLACYIIVNMLYHYVIAAFTAASPVPPPPSPSHPRQCPQCGTGKGERVHHCRICNRCTSLLDHHCPFTANCVGSSTLRPFYLWLSFCLLGLLYGAAMSWPAFHHCILFRQQQPLESTGDFTFTAELFPAALSSAGPSFVLWSRHYCKSLSNVSWTFLLVAFGLLPVVALWGLQTALIQVDRTTLEVIAAFGEKGKGQRVEATVAAVDGGEAGTEGGGRGGEMGVSRGVRKTWALIHRHEPLYRLLAPDPVWRLCRRSRAKHKG